ncbi:MULTISPECIES: alpha/beta fold hydrolase [unclassified Lactobacillus]|uniref:alpha/beta fold hydrolase n=1 Tax=unclassified Lactobacillus TaxID=2620435 RepID=UPI002269E515|nr:MULTISPECIES: alpha/beta hydrolase [unclassified Lactobacillus]MCX8721753.1 alpha/beta hydrolase [Lactobacillus sp. B4010]MCX8732459.1 alpha/beta hydrolase [Lactobacillus sp. B4015]MCX8734679.1 alpha/beta hydrolase [Lactobacillus sp. B4012]
MSIFKTSDNVELNFHLYGTGKPLILITGFGGYQEVWTKQVSYLRKMGYSVLTYDHRNMGKSQRTAKGQSLERITKDLIELLSFLKITRSTFIGHSMGGSIIYNLLKIKPQIIDIAVIIDQSPYMLNTKSWHYGFMNFTLENYQDLTLLAPQVHETIHGIDSSVMTELLPAKIAYSFDRKANLDLLQEHVQLDWRKIIKRSSQKMIIFAAEKSPYYPFQFANWMAEQNPQITAAIVPNCGHDIMAEVPQQFNQLLRHFLLLNHYLPQ